MAHPLWWRLSTEGNIYKDRIWLELLMLLGETKWRFVTFHQIQDDMYKAYSHTGRRGIEIGRQNAQTGTTIPWDQTLETLKAGEGYLPVSRSSESSDEPRKWTFDKDVVIHHSEKKRPVLYIWEGDCDGCEQVYDVWWG